MKKFLLLFVAMLMFFGVATSVGAALITFDDFGLIFGDKLNGDEYISQGIQFSTPDLYLQIGTTPSGLSQPNSLGAAGTADLDFTGGINLEFVGGKYSTDLSFYIFNPAFQASAYDIDGLLLTTIIGSNSPFTQLFDFSGFNVNRVEITGNFYAIDDVSFGELYASVPEPATMLLLGFGIIGLAGLRRRV